MGDLRLWAERLRMAQVATRREARCVTSGADGPLAPAGRLAASGAAWQGPFADHLTDLVRSLERRLDLLAEHLFRMAGALERLADETEHASRLEISNLPAPLGFDLFASLASVRTLAFAAPAPLPHSWLDHQRAPSAGHVAIDTDRARDLARHLRDGGDEMLCAYRRLRNTLAELDLEAPAGLASLAHAADDLASEVIHRVEAYEEADRRAAQGFHNLMSSAAAAGSQAGLALARLSASRSTRTREGWQSAALRRAGIDVKQWNPKRGVAHNRKTIEKVYAYYGDLYQQHPELEWLGLAALAGPFFYAGWLDLDAVRKVADPGKRSQMIFKLLGLPKLPEWAHEVGGAVLSPVFGLANLLGEMSSKELDWFLDLFLDMQKQIFMDLGWQHEAYIAGGITEMRRQKAAGAIDGRTLQAWENIASGDPERIARGTNGLVDREQRQVIQNEYDQMRGHHGPVGEAFTLAVTWMADNPIAGGRSYRDLFHHNIHLGPDLPKIGPFDPPDISIETPKGNVASVNDRMRWINADVVPAYQEFIHDHPQEMRRILQTPVAARAAEFRRLGG